MRNVPHLSLALGALFCFSMPLAGWARQTEAASDHPAQATVVVSPERAALLAAKPTAVPMSQTSIGWIKGCTVAGRSDDCSVSGGFSLKPETPPNLQLTLGTLSIDSTHTLSILLPLNVALRPGFTIALDDQRAILGDYTTCSSVGCSGQVGLSGAEYERLLRTKSLGVLISNGRDMALRLDVSLDGLTETVRGPAMSAAEREKRHNAAVEEWKAARAAKDKGAANSAATKG